MIGKLQIKDLVYIGIVLILMLASLGTGICFIYFSDIRKISNDLKRIEQINNINDSISSYYSRKNKLPSSFDQLTQEDMYYYGPDNVFNDPKNKDKQFEYKPTSGKSYEICLEFEAGSDALAKYKNYQAGGGYSRSYLSSLESSFTRYQSNKKFEFEVGYQCLSFTTSLDPVYNEKSEL